MNGPQVSSFAVAYTVPAGSDVAACGALLADRMTERVIVDEAELASVVAPVVINAWASPPASDVGPLPSWCGRTVGAGG